MFPPGVLLCFTVKDGSGLGNLAKPICLHLKIENLLKESSLSLGGIGCQSWKLLGERACWSKAERGHAERRQGGQCRICIADWAKSWTLSVSANLSCDWGQKLSSAVRANGQKLDRAPAPAPAGGAQPILCHFFFFIRNCLRLFRSNKQWHNHCLSKDKTT